jgi:hypothetical protein
MFHKAILVCTAISLLVTPAHARMKKPGKLTGLCNCSCLLANGTEVKNTYDPKGFGCGSLERKTCNITDANGLVRSGTLEYCVSKREDLLVKPQ